MVIKQQNGGFYARRYSSVSGLVLAACRLPQDELIDARAVPPLLCGFTCDPFVVNSKGSREGAYAFGVGASNCHDVYVPKRDSQRFAWHNQFGAMLRGSVVQDSRRRPYGALRSCAH